MRELVINFGAKILRLHLNEAISPSRIWGVSIITCTGGFLDGHVISSLIIFLSTWFVISMNNRDKELEW